MPPLKGSNGSKKKAECFSFGDDVFVMDTITSPEQKLFFFFNGCCASRYQSLLLAGDKQHHRLH